MNAAILSVLVTANTNQATRSMLRFNATMKATESSSNKALGAVKTLAKGASIGAGAGLAYAVKKAADFEQQLDSLGAVTRASGRDMERFRKQAMKAGADTKFSALDAAVAQTELAKGGLSVRNIMRGGLRSALALAAAGELELGEAATFTVNSMKLFGIRGKDSIKVADALATAANATTADVRDFGMALQQGGTSAKAAGLTFQETVATLEALASIGIKNTDAGTSLKTTFAQLATPTAKASELMKKLNLEFFDSKGNIKSIVDISAMLRDRFGGLTKEQRLQAAATLAGTDGMRTLLALFDVGPQKLAKFEKGLNKQGSAAEVAAKKQDNLKGKLENLQGSVETLAIAFGTKLLPSLTKAAEDITDVLNDKTLTSGEKFSKLGDMLGKAMSAAGPVVAKAAAKLGVIAVQSFFNAFRNSPIWIKLLTAGFLISKFGGFTAFTNVGRKAGTAMGEGMATGAATTFGSRAKARLFGIGKGLLAGALVAGLADGLTRTDIKGFDRIQQALSTASLGLIPSPKTISEKFNEAIKFATQGGSLVKPGFSRTLLGGLSEGLDDDQKKIVQRLHDIRKQAVAAFGPQAKLRLDVAVNAGRAEKELTDLTAGFSRMRSNSILNVKQLREVTTTNFRAIKDVLGVNSKAGAEAVRRNLGLGLQSIRQLMKEGTISTRQGTREMARLLKTNSATGKEALKANMFQIYRAIASTMNKGVKVTDKGAGVIRQIFAQQLKLYGLSAESIKFRLQGKEQSGKTIGAPLVGKQRGGPINAGAPSGDSVPAMLERGEYVLNRRAVARVGKQKLDAINFAGAPRFQAGGLAGMVSAANRLDRAHFPYVWGGGHSATPAPFGPMDCSGAVSYVLQHGGVKIPTMVSGALAGAGQPGPGRVTVFANSGHTFMRIGQRYFGTSGANPGGGAGWFPDPGAGYRAGFAQRHFAAGGAGLGRVGKLNVVGPDGALRDVVQGAVDSTRRAANARLKDLAATAIGRGDAGDPGPFGLSGSWVKALESIAKARHWSVSAWKKLVQGESGGNPEAVNPTSGAFGLGQFLGSTAREYAPFGALSHNPVKQIQAMARYIADRYGNPTNAYNQWLARSPHWYAKGGEVGIGHWGATGSSAEADRLEKKHRGKANLGKMLTRTLKALRGGKSAKARGKQLRAFEKQVRKTGGLPKALSEQLASLSQSSEIYGDYADRAGQLSVDNEDGTSTPGLFKGKNEASWLQAQLDVLFRWRNKLVDAVKIVEKRRKEIAKLLKRAKARLEQVKRDVQSVGKHQRQRRKQLEVLRKHPKRNKAQIAALRKVIMTVDNWVDGRARERKLLAGRIVPVLSSRQGVLKTLAGDLAGPDGLAGVQGPGGPMGRLAALPPLGTLGGSIFDVQLRLRDLAAPSQRVSDNSPVTDEGTLEQLKELLRQANLRTAVSEAQFKVLQDFPATSGLQQFATGGVVQGPVGTAQPAIVHGGEGVFTRDQMAAMGSGGDVQVIINGDITNVPRGKQPVEVRGRNVRVRNRAPLPGRGGGGF